jgi:ATP-binding cassette subfamily F protein 3
VELLRVTKLAYRHAGRNLLHDIDLTVNTHQKIGLVGRNGAGKSTLLALLGGRLRPDEGTVWRAPGLRLEALEQSGSRPLEGTVWGYASQSLHHLQMLEQGLRAFEQRLGQDLGQDEAQLERYGELLEQFERAGGYDATARLERTLTALGFPPERWSQPVASLSGGERARLALGRALVPGADLLLLDEPSNHLDIRSRNWLADALQAYPGTLILASHDRALLDAVTTHTLHLHDGTLDLHRGGYSTFRQRLDTLHLARQRDAHEAEKNRRHLQESMNRLRGWGTPTAARQRRNIAKRLERLEDPSATAPSAREEVTLTTQTRRGTLLEAQHLSLVVHDHVVLQDADLHIAAGDKIAIVGPNGTGKTSFLKLLAGDLASEHPQTRFHWGRDTRVAVFDQATHGLEPDKPPLIQLERYVSPERAKMLLSLVGLGQETWDREPHELSGGQQARAGVALLMASEANLLLLDEPTEHLDIELIEKLETALVDTRAAVVLVSHDQALVTRVATRVLTIADGQLKEFRGGLTGYYQGTLRLDAGPQGRPGEAPEGPAPSALPADDQEELERERLELEDRLSDPFSLTERELARYRERYHEVLDALSVLYDARLPPAAPSLQARDGNVVVTEEASDGSRYTFTSNAGLRATVLFSPTAGVAHLALQEPSETCILPWARTRVMNALVRLAFERLGARALQLQSIEDLSETVLRPAGSDWWVLAREQYEQAHGYPTNPPASPVRRHPKRRRRRKPTRS